MADFGIDVSTYLLNDDGEPDLDPTFTLMSGERVVAEAVLRRWEDHGALRELLSKRVSTNDLLELRGAMAAEAERDERVFAARVELEATGDRSLGISAEIDTADGTFELVAAVSDVTIELLSPEE